MQSIEKIVTGLDDEHITQINGQYQPRIHKDVVEPWYQLKELASKDGFDLQIISSFRTFEHQLKIWNNKATGNRTLLDQNGCELCFEDLTQEEVMHSILRWSALPGASRHHWGTDFDIYDQNCCPPDYDIQLTQEEYSENGLFSEMNEWFEDKIKSNKSFGFYRPYNKDRGGVCPEPWHISYRPLADSFMKSLTLNVLRSAIEQSQIELKDLILSNLSEIYERYVLCID